MRVDVAVSRFRRLSRRGPRCRAVVLVCITATSLIGCSSGSSTDSKQRRLSTADAELLANALFSNYDNKGATFELAVQVASGKSLNLKGEVDWSNHRGHASVAGQGAEAGVREVYWNDSIVLERRPDLNEVVAETHGAEIQYVARPIDGGRYLDQVLGEITAFAAAQRDNPQIIKDSEDSAFLRTDTLRGVDVNVLRYGALTTYWLAADDGRMLRLEANNSPGTRPLVFDALTHGEQAIPGPAPANVIDVAEIKAIYEGFLDADG